MRTWLKAGLGALAVLGAAMGIAAAQEPAAPDAQAIGERLDAYFAPLAAAHDFSGSIRIELGDGGVIERAYGYANRETSRANDSHTLFGAGSVTKGVTAALITELARDGALNLDDAVTAHVPAFTLSARMTIAHVLTHRAGLPRDVPADVDLSAAPGGLVGWLNTQTLTAAPGEAQAYSNVGYALLALVVESASGARFDDFARARALAPAGMQESFISRGNIGDDARAALGYDAGPGPTEIMRTPAWPERVGASGLVSNPGELILWMRAVVTDRFPGLRTETGLLGSFSEGEYEGMGFVRAQGTTRGYASGVSAFADQGVFIAYATNLETWINFGVENVLYAIVFDAEAPAPLPSRPQTAPLSAAHRALIGAYVHPGFGPIHILEQADGLYLRLEGLGADFYLTPLEDGAMLWRLFNTTLRPETGEGSAPGLSGEQALQLQEAVTFVAPRRGE